MPLMAQETIAANGLVTGFCERRELMTRIR
jgi:hypothetical protein